MYNNGVIVKKTRLINKSSKKFRKTLTIKRNNPVNLKNSNENYNKNDYSSENYSNMNIKTAAQSKFISDTSSIHPIKTNPEYKIKKSFFSEEKEKEKEDKNQAIKSHHHSLDQSIKNRTQLDLYKIKNLKRDKIFFEKNNIKNEIIQCESSNFNNENDFRNIFEKDKKIDRMAKKLILKLNEEEYYDRDKSFRSLFGNNITLKNGFFNGTNLVLNKLDDKKIENKSNNNKMNKNNILQNKINNNLTNPDISNTNIYNKTQGSFQSNKYISNLPLFLREKANIQGTEILSPFCKEARDEFLFNKIFNAEFNRKLTKRFHLINNKLNIFYAENENQYINKMKKINNKLRLKGKKKTHSIGPTKDEMRLDKIKTTLSFIKKIFDYSYPNMILCKVRKSGRYYDKKSLMENNIPPYKKAELLQKKRNEFLSDYLKMSIDIQKNYI